jgi:hypothetical protein
MIQKKRDDQRCNTKVRRKNGNVMELDNKKKKLVHLLKNSRQRVMKAVLGGCNEPTWMVRDARGRVVVVVRASVKRYVA